MNKHFADLILKMFCRSCFHVYDFIVDSRSDLKAFERYCQCPHCNEKNMQIVSREKVKKNDG